MISAKIQFSVRPPQEDDLSFIYSSWLKSYRNSDRNKSVSDQIYFATQKQMIEQTLQHAQTVIAFHPEDSSLIFAYLIWSPIANNTIYLHYLYTRYTSRKLGIAQSLLRMVSDANTTIVCTNINEQIFFAARKKGLKVVNEREFSNKIKQQESSAK